MFAIAAAISFGVACVLTALGQGDSKVILALAFLGAVLVALHLAFGSVITIRRGAPPA